MDFYHLPHQFDQFSLLEQQQQTFSRNFNLTIEIGTHEKNQYFHHNKAVLLPYISNQKSMRSQACVQLYHCLQFCTSLQYCVKYYTKNLVKSKQPVYLPILFVRLFRRSNNPLTRDISFPSSQTTPWRTLALTCTEISWAYTHKYRIKYYFYRKSDEQRHHFVSEARQLLSESARAFLATLRSNAFRYYLRIGATRPNRTQH